MYRLYILQLFEPVPQYKVCYFLLSNYMYISEKLIAKLVNNHMRAEFLV